MLCFLNCFLNQACESIKNSCQSEFFWQKRHANFLLPKDFPLHAASNCLLPMYTAQCMCQAEYILTHSRHSKNRPGCNSSVCSHEAEKSNGGDGSGGQSGDCSQWEFHLNLPEHCRRKKKYFPLFRVVTWPCWPMITSHYMHYYGTQPKVCIVKLLSVLISTSVGVGDGRRWSF